MYTQQSQSFKRAGLGDFGRFLSSKQKRIFKAVATGGMSEAWRHRKKILRVGMALGTGGMSELIRKERQAKGIPMNAPVTKEEIEAAKEAERKKEEEAIARREEAAARRKEAAEQRKLIREELTALRKAAESKPGGPSPAQLQMMQTMQQQMLQFKTQMEAQRPGAEAAKTTRLLIGITALGFLGLIAILAFKN